LVSFVALWFRAISSLASSLPASRPSSIPASCLRASPIASPSINPSAFPSAFSIFCWSGISFCLVVWAWMQPCPRKNEAQKPEGYCINGGSNFKFQPPNFSWAMSSGLMYSTPLLHWSQRSLKVPVVLPEPFGQAITNNTGLRLMHFSGFLGVRLEPL
jgi:hypothetical protein